MRRSLLAACLLCPVLASADAIKLGYNGPPDTDKNAVHLFATNLERLLEERTDIELELVPNSQLGDEQERMENVLASPGLNIASFAGLSPVVQEVFVASTPFLFEGFDQARRFFDEGEYWRMVSEAFRERTGSEILEVVEEGGFLAFTSSEKAIEEAADFEGMKFRAMDPSQVALYESFGASGTPIPWTEVYSALKTGVADGQMNPPLYIMMGSLHEVQKHMTLANVQYSMQFLVGNGEWLAGLSDEERRVLDEAVAEANRLNREDVETRVEERIQALADEGMNVIRPDDEQMATFREQGQPGFLDWLEEKNIDRSFVETAFRDAGKSDLLSSQ